MPTATYGVSLTVGGISIQNSIARTADHPNTYEVSLPAGTAGTLTTRTDDDTGDITAAGHGLVATDDVDVHWDAAGVMKNRYGMKVSAVAGDVVTVGTAPGDIGAGDVLPAATTAVVITKQVTVNTTVDGDTVQIAGIVAESGKAHIDMQDTGNVTIHEADLVKDTPQVHDVAGGATNVFTGNPITHSKATAGISTAAVTLKVAFLEDSTP